MTWTAAGRGSSPRPSPMSPLLSGALAVCGVLAVVMLVAWAAVAGPDPALDGHGPVVSGETVDPIPAEGETGAAVRAPPQDSSDDAETPGWLLAVVTAAQVVVLLAVLALLVLSVRRLYDAWGRRRTGTPPVGRDFDVLDEERLVGEAMRRDAAHQQGLLEEGAADEAIIACWQRFEVQGRDAGLVRAEWETPAEFALRVLDVAGVDGHAVVELADLFREARFSSHRLGEPDRARARAALARIHASMGRVPR